MSINFQFRIMDSNYGFSQISIDNDQYDDISRFSIYTFIDDEIKYYTYDTHNTHNINSEKFQTRNWHISIVKQDQ